MNFIEADGGTLAVEVRGEGPLVVCSPAMGDLRDAFDPLAECLLAAGYRVAQLDLRGHGDSSTGFGSYGDVATGNDLVTIVEALGGPAVLIGASLSAGGAVIAAARRPELVAGVVLIAPFVRNPRGAAVLAPVMQAMLLRPWGPAIWRRYAASLWPGLGKAGAAARAERTVRSSTRPGHWADFVRTTRGADHGVVAPSLEAFDRPALVVMGDSDRDWKDPVAEAAWVAEHTRAGAPVIVPGVGHAPMLERPEPVADAVLAFLGQVTTHATGRA